MAENCGPAMNFGDPFMACLKCLYSQRQPLACIPRRQGRKPKKVSRKTVHYLTLNAMFDAEKDRIHAINHRLDQLRGYL